MQQLQNIIETAFERRAEITPANADTVTREAVNQVIALLDSGALRVAEKIDGQWGDASVVEKSGAALFPY
ncbi:2,3,4,5-tetrahydropyridine-2,6-carboxylate N-succinyltransferase [Escherichia coli]|uniref:2,3,4,5-tetrahydropyridine-2,6-carboxylate N-succinyltransferase n=1 Tax=Escherichia coli TaxID=562 RepID=A0A376K5E9_ECOLX|nr:2,3,4,5-tetrahydropyridine-2,6-carboxylate N-succinyltransferase [Escherichia coli]